MALPSSQEIIRRYKKCGSVVQTEYSSNVVYVDARSQLCNMVVICCNEKWVIISHCKAFDIAIS